ncbi:MAG: exosome complex RNA-binding protein Rrp4 [Nanoarchaeota archaeon]
MEERKIVVPGESIIEGNEYLPGDGTYRDKNDVVAGRYGLADISGRLVKVIPLSGVYRPRTGNMIIGLVTDITLNGWIVDLQGPMSGFLSLSEVPTFVNRGELKEHFDFGDVIMAKVSDVKDRGIDLSVKLRGCGKLEDGMIIKVNSNKVPRVIGKEGSMVNLIKEATNCNIKIGQNGLIWIKGNDIEAELRTKKVIDFICENSFVEGLTDKVKEFLESKDGQ